MVVRIHSDRIEVNREKRVLKRITGWTCEQLIPDVRSLDIVFVNDKELQQLHAHYLDDDSPSDVITFDLGEGNSIEGEIYISLDRAQEQARRFRVSLLNEICRLIIHGCLHLAGYSDLRTAERRVMKKKEEDLLQQAMYKAKGKKIKGKG